MAKKSKIGKIAATAAKVIVPLTISVGLCYLLFTGIDFRMMLDIIRHQCNFNWILLGLVFAIAAQVFRGYRWGLQLKALGITPPPLALTLSIFGTYAVNLVFPRLGEVWRSGYIAQRQHAPFATVFGSMVADRLSDTAAVLLMGLWAFFAAQKTIIRYLQANGDSYNAIGALATSPWLWCAVLALVAALWILMKIRTRNPVLIRIQRALLDLWKGFVIILTMRGKAKWLFFTVCIWGCYFMQTYLTFYAFPFTHALLDSYGAEVAFVTFVLGSISMGVPSNGGIGPWQWAVIIALGIYGLQEHYAAAYANLVLGTTTLLTIVLGIFTFTMITLRDKRDKIAAAVRCKTANTNNHKA